MARQLQFLQQLSSLSNNRNIEAVSSVSALDVWDRGVLGGGVWNQSTDLHWVLPTPYLRKHKKEIRVSSSDLRIYRAPRYGTLRDHAEVSPDLNIGFDSPAIGTQIVFGFTYSHMGRNASLRWSAVGV